MSETIKVRNRTVTRAAISATFTAWATVIDAQIATALARALGATPRQISAGLTTAQLLGGLVAACVGIPPGCSSTSSPAAR